MANITYQVTRWDVSCCHHTHPTQAGYAESCILGITATDSESGKSAYKDERISVNPCVELAEFEKNAEQWIENQIGSGGWYLELQTRIAAQLSAPEPAPSGRVQPDFSKMVIGDGYHDLPDVLEEREPEVTEVEVFPEEPVKPTAKKKAKKPKEENLAEEEKKEDNAEATPESGSE